MRTLLNIHQPIAGWALASILMFSPVHWAQSPSASGDTLIVLEEVSEEVWEDVFTYVFAKHFTQKNEDFETFYQTHLLENDVPEEAANKTIRTTLLAATSPVSRYIRKNDNQASINIIDTTVTQIRNTIKAIEREDAKVKIETSAAALAFKGQIDKSEGMRHYVYLLLRTRGFVGTGFNYTAARKEILNQLVQLYFNGKWEEQELALKTRYESFLSDVLEPTLEQDTRHNDEIFNLWEAYYQSKTSGDSETSGKKKYFTDF